MMFNSKYSNFLTILLIVVIVAIVGLLGYLGYDFYRKYYIEKEADDFLQQYGENIKKPANREEKNEENSTEGEQEEQGEIQNPYGEEISVENNSNPSGNTTQKYTYKGFTVLGQIEIPKTNVKYPILEKVTKKSLETSVAIMYGPGPNEIGNTTIAGHNYRNGLFFSNNKKLANGDKIYITDNSGQRITYVIYSIFEESPDYTDFMTRDVGNAREISLQTCTDDSKARLIILAKEE